MNETELEPNRDAAAEATALLKAYLRERVAPHPLLNPHLPRAAVLAAGPHTFGAWDEHSDFDLCLLLPDDEHARLARSLREAGLWSPARDFRLRLADREPFRRFPGAEIRILSASQLDAEFRAELPAALWSYSRAAVLQDPLGLFERARGGAGERFRERLEALRCEHYYRFRQARNDMVPKIVPHRLNTLLAIQRGETVREALRLAFLAEGKPYPADRWLEMMAERETACGPGIVAAVRALLAAEEAETLDHTSKVLRDRVIFALQQGGVSARWLEQWWAWPALGPADGAGGAWEERTQGGRSG
jgi:hypothetical protein